MSSFGGSSAPDERDASNRMFTVSVSLRVIECERVICFYFVLVVAFFYLWRVLRQVFCIHTGC